MTLGRLIDRELDPARPIGDNLGHECRVLCGNVIVREMHHLLEAKHMVIKGNPLVHAPQLDVAHDMIDRRQPGWHDARRILYGMIARREGPMIVMTFDE